MGEKHSGAPGVPCRHSVSQQLRQALEKMKSASALISAMIEDERGAGMLEEALERLYVAKGAVTCAIEQTEQELSYH